MLNVILFGPPGSGKGTQAEGLSKGFGLKQISTGALVRDQITKGTEIGQALADSTARGDLVPDSVVTDLLRAELSIRHPAIHGYIFDGYPRTLPQVFELQTLLDELKMAVDVMIELRLPDRLLIERITGRYLCRKCGKSFHDTLAPAPDECCGEGWVRRPEDNPDALANRLARYHSNTRDVLSIFARHPNYRIVDAALPIDVVTRSLRATVIALEN